ncbi:MAG: PRC-barrel domain-containing protein [Candidatus Thermoplasmatota archaeon]|nr:PRC-barrel domain-containing protein [Candidatus Thermoplasmatota archaeon]
MPTAFSAELSGRRVLDSRGDLLGTIVDLFLDDINGEVLGLLLDLDEGLDPNLLPWDTFGEHLVIPTEVVAGIDEDVHLNR